METSLRTDQMLMQICFFFLSCKKRPQFTKRNVCVSEKRREEKRREERLLLSESQAFRLSPLMRDITCCSRQGEVEESVYLGCLSSSSSQSLPSVRLVLNLQLCIKSLMLLAGNVIRTIKVTSDGNKTLAGSPP